MTGLAGASVAFRADASLQIGTGHVMRCLTLAAALRAQGAPCHFICRAHDGNLIDVIDRQGHAVTALPLQADAASPSTRHRDWLGSDAPTDAALTIAALAGRRTDWLVVDHYALDAAWESALRQHAERLLVIDDLADRPHDCDLLLDQNLGRTEAHYVGRVPTACHVLAGPHYALLRPEFAALREVSLQRRAATPMKRQLLITMGGVDAQDATGAVLRALQALPNDGLPAEAHITVVMGAAAPWLERVRSQAANMRWPTEVLVGIGDMAQRMAQSDLAIGAAGATAWERCCLGLPSLLVVLADNQAPGAAALAASGAAVLLGSAAEVADTLAPALNRLMHHPELATMSDAAAHITDGAGVGRVLAQMERRHA